MRRGVWTTEELEILRKYYRKRGATYVGSRIGRSADSVMAKAAALGISFDGFRPWEPWEDRYLQRHNDDRSNASLARSLKRSIPSIRSRLKKLGLTSPQPRRWTGEEKAILREQYPNWSISLNDLAQRLCRTRYSILIEAQVLGLRRPQHEHEWTKEEHAYVVKNRRRKSYREMAQHLGLTESAVAHHVVRSGLAKRTAGRRWTEAEKEYLRASYKIVPTREIAARLNRTYDTVVNYAGIFGLSAGPSKPWTNEETSFLRENYGRQPIDDLARTMGRSVKAVEARAVKLRLTRPRRKRS